MKVYSHPHLGRISLEKVMHALSHHGRLRVVQALLKAKDLGLTCQDIPLKVSKATRSHHFEVLRDAGFISCRVQGTSCLIHLRKKEFNQRFPGLLKLVAQIPQRSNK